MAKGEFWYATHCLEMGAWTAFVIWCFWHNHATTAWIVIGMLVLDGIGTHERLKEFRALESTAQAK